MKVTRKDLLFVREEAQRLFLSTPGETQLSADPGTLSEGDRMALFYLQAAATVYRRLGLIPEASIDACQVETEIPDSETITQGFEPWDQ